MNKNWPNKEKDIYVAEQIMEEYASQNNSESLGLFELFVNPEEKRMNFRLSNWVITIAEHFKSVYGEAQGEFVTRKVITRCLVNGQTLH
ncbi:Uncharacterised protein [Legionella beliardensis]|uniref:Uncharacterized protein n=1 Tax=Legionella beliardensis TaxID=91822 RepID=A0A378I488_9GAMM|nr:hypothetical protein [Legionella beliardensis]STX29535.1 Uncharacterised protein [Legionella beliardensis]